MVGHEEIENATRFPLSPTAHFLRVRPHSHSPNDDVPTFVYGPPFAFASVLVSGFPAIASEAADDADTVPGFIAGHSEFEQVRIAVRVDNSKNNGHFTTFLFAFGRQPVASYPHRLQAKARWRSSRNNQAIREELSNRLLPRIIPLAAAPVAEAQTTYQ